MSTRPEKERYVAQYERAYFIQTVDTHTGGDPTRIVVGGLPEIKGSTMMEKKQYLIDHFDFVRTSLMLEPRGHKDMFGAVLTEPVSPEADIGVVFMDTGGYLNMCGHGTIGVVTAILETGIVNKDGKEVHLNLDTPAGLVKVKAVRNDRNKVESVSLVNVPSFLWEADRKIKSSKYGELTIDVAFGGSFYAIVDPKAVGLPLEPKYADQLRDAGMLLLKEVNEQVQVQHPTLKEINRIDLILFVDKSPNEGIHTRNVAVFGRSNVARSACGTGLSAQMATQYAKNKLGLNEYYNTESIIQTVFKGRLLEETQVGDRKAVVPEITGDANVTGKHEFLITSDDPLSNGFLLGEN